MPLFLSPSSTFLKIRRLICNFRMFWTKSSTFPCKSAATILKINLQLLTRLFPINVFETSHQCFNGNLLIYLALDGLRPPGQEVSSLKYSYTRLASGLWRSAWSNYTRIGGVVQEEVQYSNLSTLQPFQKVKQGKWQSHLNLPILSPSNLLTFQP